jgi:hypothetical protein
MLRIRAFVIFGLLILLLAANAVTVYANVDFPCGGC